MILFFIIFGNLIYVCNGCLKTPTVDSAPLIVVTTMDTISCGANPCPPIPPGIMLGPDVIATGPSATGTPPSCTFSYTLTCVRAGATGLLESFTLTTLPNPSTFTCDGTSRYTFGGGMIATDILCI